MAHNTRIRADLPAWQAAVPLEPEECDAIDAAQFAAINGDAGGAWAPAAAIEVGGAGVEHAGPVVFKTGGAFSIENGVICSLESTGQICSDPAVAPPRLQFVGIGDFNVNSGGEINVNTGGEIVVKSGATVDVQTGGVQSVSGVVDVESGGVINVKSGGSLVVRNGGGMGVEASAAVVFASGSSLSMGGTIDGFGAAEVTGEFGGSPEWTGNHTFSGHVIEPVYTNAVDNNGTLSGNYRYNVNPAGVFSANRTWTVSDGTIVGQKIMLRNADATRELAVTITGDTIPPLLLAAGYNTAAEWYWDGSAWRLLWRDQTP